MRREFYKDLISSTILSIKTIEIVDPPTRISYPPPTKLMKSVYKPSKTLYMNQELWDSFIKPDPFHKLHAEGHSKFDSGTRPAYTYLDQLGDLE